MAHRIVVTRRIPEPALDLLRAAGDTWLNLEDRPLTRDELHEAIAGADAVVTLLHDRVTRPSSTAPVRSCRWSRTSGSRSAARASPRA